MGIGLIRYRWNCDERFVPSTRRLPPTETGSTQRGAVFSPANPSLNPIDALLYGKNDNAEMSNLTITPFFWWTARMKIIFYYRCVKSRCLRGLVPAALQTYLCNFTHAVVSNCDCASAAEIMTGAEILKSGDGASAVGSTVAGSVI